MLVTMICSFPTMFITYQRIGCHLQIQCTYPCFPGVLLTSTLHNILSKPLAASHITIVKTKESGDRGMNPSQWLSSIFGKNIGQARDWTSDLLLSSPQCSWVMGLGKKDEQAHGQPDFRMKSNRWQRLYHCANKMLQLVHIFWMKKTGIPMIDANPVYFNAQLLITYWNVIQSFICHREITCNRVHSSFAWFCTKYDA